MRAGRAKAGRTLDGFDVVPTVPLVVGEDPRACADPVRAYAALYVGGMGSREQNFYNALAVRMGFGEAAATVQDLYLVRRHRDAQAAVPFEFIDQTSLLGDRARIADRLRVLAEAGVTTCSVVPVRRLGGGEAQRDDDRRRGARVGRDRSLGGRRNRQTEPMVDRGEPPDLVAPLLQHPAVDRADRPAGPRARDRVRPLLPHRAAELLPVPARGRGCRRRPARSGATG